MTETTISQQNEEKTEIEIPREKYGEIIESILFAAGHQVKYDVLARVLGTSEKKIREYVAEYAEKYNSTKEVPRGVTLLVYDDCCQLCTKKENINYIRDALGIRKNGTLSASSLETLAIIAYNQPVTRTYVDTVRGVDSSYAISSLVDRGLIECKGRLDAPGRPMLYGTGVDFLRCFGFSSLADLPGANSDEIAELFARIKNNLPDGLTSAGDGAQIKMFDAEEPDEKVAEIGSPSAQTVSET